MRKLAIVLVPLLVLALVMGAVGCGCGGGEPTPTPTATPALALDSDGDGWGDAQEQTAGTNPYSADTDGDGYWDPLDPNPLDSTIPRALTPAPTPTPTPTSQPLSLQLPCRFYGTVQIDGADVVDGTVIAAKIQGDTHTTVVATTIYGPSTYALKIVPLQGKWYIDGSPIVFYIGGRLANQSAVWVRGGNFMLDLSVGEPPPLLP